MVDVKKRSDEAEQQMVEIRDESREVAQNLNQAKQEGHAARREVENCKNDCMEYEQKLRKIDEQKNKIYTVLCNEDQNVQRAMDFFEKNANLFEMEVFSPIITQVKGIYIYIY